MLNNSNPNNSNSQVKEAWGKFLSTQFDWDLFATLTFRDNVTERLANTRFKNFIRTMRHRTGHRSEFIRVTEYGKWNRAKPHYHCLIGNAKDIRRLGMVDWWWGQGYGIARVEKYDSSKGAGYYLGKYLLKQNSDILISRGINKLAKGSS